MLFLSNHGGHAKGGPVGAYSGDRYTSLQSACGYAASEKYPEDLENHLGPFGYFFADAPSVPHDADTTDRLDKLADAMIDQPPLPEGNAPMSAVFTYWGQFIDHDITAGSDRETGPSVIDSPEVLPADRTAVSKNLFNLRSGALDLDSLYGGAALQGKVAAKFAAALRHPQLRAKLRMGTAIDLGTDSTPPLPKDPARDLLRFGRVVDDPGPFLTEAEIADLPDELRERFFAADLSPKRASAVIGDARNDENLAVAQFHMAWARFHNKMVDHAHLAGKAGLDDAALFDWAREQVVRTYQWLILHEFLPGVCNPDIVAETIADGAPLYDGFFKANPPPHPGLMPLPLEFSVAAFRFGHSMIRGRYDWSRHFGTPVPGFRQFAPFASLNDLFTFTGNATPPMGGIGDRLPSNWVVEMDRLMNLDGSAPNRNARPIDTHLAPPLGALPNVDTGTPAIMKHLARRNLRRGHRLNLPTAQACLDGLAQKGIVLPRLSADELKAGPLGEQVAAGGFHEATPLWFYILAEAEIEAGRLAADDPGRGRLGALGSRLVAEVLVGLIRHSADSVWTAPGSDGGRWHPRDGVQPFGRPIDSLAEVMRVALLLEP
jgi:hypothetical protein